MATTKVKRYHKQAGKLVPGVGFSNAPQPDWADPTKVNKKNKSRRERNLAAADEASAFDEKKTTKSSSKKNTKRQVTQKQARIWRYVLAAIFSVFGAFLVYAVMRYNITQQSMITNLYGVALLDFAIAFCLFTQRRVGNFLTRLGSIFVTVVFSFVGGVIIYIFLQWHNNCVSGKITKNTVCMPMPAMVGSIILIVAIIAALWLVYYRIYHVFRSEAMTKELSR